MKFARCFTVLVCVVLSLFAANALAQCGGGSCNSNQGGASAGISAQLFSQVRAQNQQIAQLAQQNNQLQQQLQQVVSALNNQVSSNTQNASTGERIVNVQSPGRSQNRVQIQPIQNLQTFQPIRPIQTAGRGINW